MIFYAIPMIITIIVYLFIGILFLSTARDNGDYVKGWKNKTKMVAGYPFVWLGWLDPYGGDE
jgi:hypothetical protein